MSRFFGSLVGCLFVDSVLVFVCGVARLFVCSSVGWLVVCCIGVFLCFVVCGMEG